MKLVNLRSYYATPGYSQSEHPTIFFAYLSFDGNHEKKCIAITLEVNRLRSNLSCYNVSGQHRDW